MFLKDYSKISKNSNKLNTLESFLSRWDQWLFDMSPGITEFLSSNQILLVKLKDASFQLADLKLYIHQFCPFSSVIHHLK